MLLDIDGSRFLATAAQVLNTSGLLIGGEPDLIPLSGDFYRSNGKGAPDDNIDLAVTLLSGDQRLALKGLPFIRAGDMLHSTLTENRYQLTVGYRASQNKAPTDGSKDLQPTRWNFTGRLGGHETYPQSSYQIMGIGFMSPDLSFSAS